MKLKRFENFNEMDPYGEEDWNDEKPMDIYLKIIKDLGFNIVNIRYYYGDINDNVYYVAFMVDDRNYSLVKTDLSSRDYEILVFCKYISGNMIRIGILPILDNQDVMKKELLELIKIGNLKENVNNEIDPYGEENWNLDIDIGDIVKLFNPKDAFFTHGNFFDADYMMNKIGEITDLQDLDYAKGVSIPLIFIEWVNDEDEDGDGWYRRECFIKTEIDNL